MAKIKIDSQTIVASSKNITTYITELEALNKRLESLTNRISSSWDGESSDTYVALMRSYISQAKNLIGVLKEYRKYLDKTANDFSKTDKNNARKIRSS